MRRLVGQGTKLKNTKTCGLSNMKFVIAKQIKHILFHISAVEKTGVLEHDTKHKHWV